MKQEFEKLSTASTGSTEKLNALTTFMENHFD